MSVSWTTTIVDENLRARTPAPPLRPVSFSVELTLVLEICSAGARPKMIPVSTQSPARNRKTRVSIVNRIQYGLPTSWVARSNIRTPMIESARPRTPPSNPRSTASTSSWRTMRQRDAPSARRTAISRARCAARESSRLATFAQAISRTKPTAPINVRNMIRMGPPLKRSLMAITSTPMSLFVSGYCAVSRLAMPRNSVCAVVMLTPGLSRPNRFMLRLSRRRSGSAGASACQRSELFGNFTPCGITPMMVEGTSLILTDLPRMFGSPP